MKVKITHQQLLELLSIGLRNRGLTGIEMSDMKVSSFCFIKGDWDDSVELTIIPYNAWDK
jgi:hypothetical protein